MSQFKGVQGSKPLRENSVQSGFANNHQRAGEPIDEQQRVSFGQIAEVNEDTQRVRVDIFGRNGNLKRLGKTERNPEGPYIPVLQPLQVIHHLFGSLRKGLIVRVWWRGKQAPASEAIAEIVTDQEGAVFFTGEESARSNELATSPHEIFAGGVSSF